MFSFYFIMALYQISISCERAYQPIAPDGCRDSVMNCDQKDWLFIELNEEPSVDDIDKLNEKYEIPPCSQTGCKRFLGTTRGRPLESFNRHLSIDDLAIKK